MIIGARTRRFSARTTSVVVALALLVSGQVASASTRGWHNLGWDLPALQQTASVPGQAGGLTGKASAPPASAPVPAVAWPAAGKAEADLPATAAGAAAPAAKPAGNLPITVTRGHGRDAKSAVYQTTGAVRDKHDTGRIAVETVDHKAADKAGLHGTLFTVSTVSGDTTGPVSVSLDYHGFSGAYGADFGSRLRLVRYPACVLTTPEKPECRTSTPVDSTNNAKDRRLTGEVTLTPTAAPPAAASPATATAIRPAAFTAAPATQTAVMAATASSNGGGGDFTATNLSPAGSWTSGGSSGDFNYSHPVKVPAAINGQAPSIALSYSSGSVDGLTSGTNNQASVVGDGWSLAAAGYIERSYKPCAKDLGGNNGQTASGDECWVTDNATLNLGGSTVPLVNDPVTGWHPKTDDGSRVEKLTGAANGALNGENWKVTTTDGTQFFFGLNHLPGWASGNPETQSTWTEPVFGNNPGEPCNQAAFANSWCQQAWRWNLDMVVDPRGNATTYYYQPETNNYGLNNNVTTPGVQYTRGGYLTRAEYGFNTNVANVYTAPPARVTFDVAERCIPNGSITCDPSQLNSTTASSWPDTPADEICAPGAACAYTSPTFFSRKRLTTITTQTSNGTGGWNSVDQWGLGQSFPATGDTSSPAMWLGSVQHTGLAGGTIALPATTFTGKLMANRVDANSNYTALTRNRLVSIVNEQGGVTSVNYSAPECVTGTNMPASPDTDTLRCFATYWTPGGATSPVLDWFNKFVVTDVTDDGRTQLSQQVLTHYDYLNGAAWHYDEQYLVDPQYRTWSQWRGYGTVKTTKGQSLSDPAGAPTVAQSLYLRGMDGDTLPGGGTRNVSVTDSIGETIPDSKPIPGFSRESLTYLNAQVIGDQINDPWLSAATATDGNGVQAVMSGTGVSRTRTWVSATSTWRTTRSATTFDNHGLPTQVENDGDIADPTQATCARTTYAQNTGSWLLKLPQQVQKITGTCVTGNQATSANIISDVRSLYDHLALGATPAAGLVTELDTIDSWPTSGSEQWQAPSTATNYDVYGRATQVTDALGRATTTAYTPATGGPVTKIATTTPQVSASNTLKLTTTKTFDAVTGALLSEVDGSGLLTSASYDALGRMTALWKPGRSQASSQAADNTYAYTVSNTTPSVVTANRLLSSGQYATSYSLVDGLGRTVQSQAPTSYSQGGRVVTDTQFDSHGRGWKVHDPYWNGVSAPNSTLLIVQDNAVPSTTVTNFDPAGRAVASIYQHNGAEAWRTTTVPDGDRTTTVPPTGGVASTTISNGLGEKTQLLQYKDPTQTGPGAAADATGYTYTPAGQLASSTDSTGRNTWTTSYDLHQRKVSSTDPDTGTSTTTYDAAGQAVSTTDGRGHTLALAYDNLGRKTGEYDGSLTGAQLAAWNYDTLLPGLPTNSIRYANGKTYTTATVGYDAGGRPTASRLTVPLSQTGFGGTYQFNNTYDPLTGAIASTSSPQKGGLGDETMYVNYNTLGKPTTLTGVTTAAAQDLVTETDYNPLDQILRMNFQATANPNQVSTTHTYEDGTNRLSGTLVERATSSAYMVANRAYSYDPSGNVTKIADTPLGTAGDVQCFNHDYLARLSQAWTPASADCTAAPSTAGLGGDAPYWNSWSFDQTGNRLTQTQHTAAGDNVSTSTYPAPGAAQPHSLQSTATTGPAGSSQNNYSYDPAGNTLSKGPAGAAQTFTYDAEGHIATATDATGKVTSYVYDADGHRLFTTDPTGVTLSVGDLDLFMATGTTSAVGTRFYSFNGQLVAERNATTGLVWAVPDAKGTTLATVDAGNLAVTKRWQEPYGNPRGTQPPSWPDKHGFVGGYQEATGLTHLAARDYDPTTGRFTQADPLLDVGDPQQWNGYAYSNNSPVTNSDPTGLHMCDVDCSAEPKYTGDTPPTEDPSYIYWSGQAAQQTERQSVYIAVSHGFSDELATSSCSRACSERGGGGGDDPVVWHPLGGAQLAAYNVGREMAAHASDEQLKSLLYQLVIGDFVDCANNPGLTASCGMAIVSLIPVVGKAGKLAKLGVDAIKDFRRTEEALSFAPDEVALLQKANAMRDAKAGELSAGSAKARSESSVVVGAYNARTGDAAVGVSSKALQECAEACAARNVGGDLGDIRFARAVRPRGSGRPPTDQPVCAAYCEPTYGREAFPDPDTNFQSDNG